MSFKYIYTKFHPILNAWSSLPSAQPHILCQPIMSKTPASFCDTCCNNISHFLLITWSSVDFLTGKHHRNTFEIQTKTKEKYKANQNDETMKKKELILYSIGKSKRTAQPNCLVGNLKKKSVSSRKQRKREENLIIAFTIRQVSKSKSKPRKQQTNAW